MRIGMLRQVLVRSSPYDNLRYGQDSTLLPDRTHPGEFSGIGTPLMIQKDTRLIAYHASIIAESVQMNVFTAGPGLRQRPVDRPYRGRQRLGSGGQRPRRWPCTPAQAGFADRARDVRRRAGGL